MNLWLLRPISEDKGTPWGDIRYDVNFGFVIRSDNEDDARTRASQESGDENRYGRATNPWLDPNQTTCLILEHDGDTGLIIRDFNAG